MDNIQFAGTTHPGRRRKENQDAFISRQLWSPDKILLTVIDGVGGYTGGEKAASIAKECIGQYMQVPSGDTLTMLREALIFANNSIVEERKKDRLTSEMCCVLTAVVADAAAQCIYYAHVGDTRLYRFRDGKLQKITSDHSFVGIREDAGDLSEEEAMQHPHRNQILREVGSVLHWLDDEDFMDYGREVLIGGDQLLLCSDGLTDMINSQNIINLLAGKFSLETKAEKLVELANEKGGHDNITVVLFELESATLPLPEIKVAIDPVQVFQQTLIKNEDKRKKSSQGKNTLVWLSLLLVLLSATGWYFAVPKKPVNVAASGLPVFFKDSITTDTSVTVIPPREVHAAIEGPVAIEIVDTLRISATKNFADIRRYSDSSGRTLLLMPKKNSGQFAAMIINLQSAKPGDTIAIKNIHITGFDTGILIKIPVKLKAENLVFENTAIPLRYLYKTDPKQQAVFFINSTKQ